MSRKLAIVAGWLELCGAAWALQVGDPAPEIRASRWIQGGPITEFTADKTYVVEFWATWCPPCRTSIPHLTHLARLYPDIPIIGMNTWERGTNPTATVETFVNKMGAQMSYPVAMDTDDQFMAKNWMLAAGQGGIPTAFVVHQGRIAWIGHPQGGLDAILDAAAKGKLDLEALRRAEEKKSSARRSSANMRWPSGPVAIRRKPRRWAGNWKRSAWKAPSCSI